ncbi:MAG: YicC family protein [Clostridia bacterium]|nr:YicC family protein [Clostridia bacterium]
MMSMTGYGNAAREQEGRRVLVEIRTVNHRFLDLAFRMPRNLLWMEDALRKEISATLERGHADVYVTYENHRSDAKRANVDTALANQYRNAAKALSEALDVRDDTGTAFYAALPDVIVLESADEDQEAVSALLLDALKEAEGKLVEMRKREGEALKTDLSVHLGLLEGLVQQISAVAPEVPALYRERLLKRLAELQIADPDPQRIAQETAMMADRCAIDEELSRLGSHIAQMRTAFEAAQPMGKRLDFLIQELNREVNTIGSKAGDARITKWVVEAKNEIEKMREQVQNVE